MGGSGAPRHWDLLVGVVVLASWAGFLGAVAGRTIEQNADGYTEETVEVVLEDLQGRPLTGHFTPGNYFHHSPATRTRRSAQPPPGDASGNPPSLRLALRRASAPLHLLLHHYVDIVAPTARLEWFDSSTNATVSRPIQDGCLYRAIMENATQYGGFLNMCNGITGVVETPDDDLFISPLCGSTEQTLSLKHVMRRPGKGHSTPTLPCGVPGMEEFRIGSSSPASGGHYSTSTRHRRDLYRRGPKYIEVLLVTDLSVRDFHGEGLMEQYLLTQLSIVNMAYQHESIGVDIRVIVNKIVLVSEETADDIVSEKTGKSTLDKFCHWVNYEQQLTFPYEDAHDLAIYITRLDIGPAGYAPVTGMCNPTRSCTVNKDDGISSAFVIAHEMGHVLGLQHDGVGNECEDDPEDGKIMAGLVQASYEKFYWTNCSKDLLARYIDHYHCLDNEPTNPMKTDFAEPFGQSWSLDEQCRQEFGQDFKLCEFSQLDPCEYLWCSTRESPMLCRTKRGPPLPGTKCAGEKWCMGGRCVWVDESLIDGGWSEWGYWTECSRTCGTGVQFRKRKCNDPPPQNGGDDCDGDAEEFQICNRFSCGGMPSDFRAQQCSWLNRLGLIDNRHHTWLPLENKNVSQLCRLTCISMETGDIIVTEENVIDGTFCSYEIANDICIQGKCQALGCDGTPNSVTREDQCGICMGHHDRCGHETGLFDIRLVKDEYYRILTIPRGARDIFIQEMESSSIHFLAVKDDNTGHFFINGGGEKGHSRQFVHKGTRFVYITRTSGETLAARGPLLGDVAIQVYSMSNKVPVQVAWRFIVPTALMGRPYMQVYYEDAARLNPVTPATTTRSRERAKTTTPTVPTHTRRNQVRNRKQNRSGTRNRQKEYEEERENRIEKTEARTPPPPPPTVYEWRFVDWTPCSVTCGEGKESSDPICARASTDFLVADEYCENVSNPGRTSRPCKEPDCHKLSPYSWVAEPWSPCTESCGRDGSQARRVHCMHNYYGENYPVDPVYCSGSVRPNYYQRCNEHPCPAAWHRGPWLKCSRKCGLGIQRREVTCSDVRDHNVYQCKGPRPRNHKPCHLRPCPARTRAPPTTTKSTTTFTTPTERPTTTRTTTTTTLSTSTTALRTTTPGRIFPTHSTTTEPTLPPTTTESPPPSTTTYPGHPLSTDHAGLLPDIDPRQPPEFDLSVPEAVDITTTQQPTSATTVRATTTTITTTTPRPTSTTTPQPPTTPSTTHVVLTTISRVAAARKVCTVDKSFFCKMAKGRNCHLPLYSSFCCASCRRKQGR